MKLDTNNKIITTNVTDAVAMASVVRIENCINYIRVNIFGMRTRHCFIH